VDGKPVGNVPLQLEAGRHTVEASALGYRPASNTFTLGSDAAKPYVVKLQLEPELVHLRLVSDLKTAKITLDGQPADLSDGGFTNENVALSSPHTLSLIQSGKESLTVSFVADPGGLVTLSGPITAKDLKAVAISELGYQARIYASDPSLKGGIKEQPIQPIPPEGMEVNVPGGDAEFVLDDGKSPRSVPIETSNAPALTIWLANDPNLGTLQIEATIPDADLYIDGRKRRPLKAGKNYYNLEAGEHVFRVAKDGYEDAPEQKVELKKGEHVEARIDLKPIPKTATLVIAGGTRDAEVLMDGQPAGTVGSDGSYRRDDVAPGSHTIMLRKSDAEPKQLTFAFTAGQSVRVAGSDAQLTPFGLIDFRITPLNASLTYQRTDESQPHAAENGKALSLRAGRYMIRATANGYIGRQDPIDLGAGKSQPIGWALAPAEEQKKASPPPPPRTLVTKDYFRDSDSWKQQGNWWLHQGEDVSWFRGNQGVYVVEILRQTSKLFKRKKRVEWIVDQKDEVNHVDYWFDFGSLERQATVNGKQEQRTKVPVMNAPPDSYTLRIEINPERIVVKDEAGKELDRYQRPNSAEFLGKFGFRGQVALVVKRGE
jgi:hypothetical protein